MNVGSTTETGTKMSYRITLGLYTKFKLHIYFDSFMSKPCSTYNVLPYSGPQRFQYT